MTTTYSHRQTTMPAETAPEQALHLVWYVAGAALAFAISFVFSSVLHLQHDLYYLVYFTFTGAFFAAYVAGTRINVPKVLRRGWRLSLALGVVVAVFVVLTVLRREDATPRPDGAYLMFEVLWRGVAYGVVDALLLTVFPVLAAYSLLGGSVQGLLRRAAFAAVALLLTLGITATYHLGYEQFREDGIANPEIGNTVISMPALVTANPAGSVLAHTAMHVAATLHAYETNVFLPPQTDAE